MLLKGVRVVEWVSESVTAAFCTRLLADLGADVVKVEPHGGDLLRRTVGPEISLADGRRERALFSYLNAGKRSLELGEKEDARRTCLAMAGDCDVIVFASLADEGAAELMQQIRQKHPKVVVLSISPFGRDDPASDAASFRSDMVLQHRGGFAYEQARPVEDPAAQPPLGGADREFALSAGVAAAASCVAALLEARMTGTAPMIDFSKLDFCAHLCLDAFCASQRGETDFARKRRSSAGTEIAGGLVWILRCVDGWAMISPREQHQWDRWVAVIGQPEWTKDAALCGDRMARRENSAAIQQLMSEWSGGRSKGEIFRMAQEARVACFPVSTSADLLENEQLHHRGFFNGIDRAENALLVPGLPFLLATSGGGRLEKRRVLEIPALGEAGRSPAAVVDIAI